MMKLKYLFNNEALAGMILGNWEHDPDPAGRFEFFRISANAVYPFYRDHKRYFLRFAPASEKSAPGVSAELDFLEFLKRKGYKAVEPVPSRNGNRMETVGTPWGEYLAAAFKGVPGIPVSSSDFSWEILFGYGKALGKLHRWSSGYEPAGNRRWSWLDVLDWSRDVLSGFSGETAALREAALLGEALSKLPVSKKTFGLLHYDFETDNVFYDAETKEFYPIDFDDAMYHWFVMDIVQAVESIRDAMEGEKAEDAVKSFMDGYCSEYEVSEELLFLAPLFKRFGNLYGYARILRSTEEKWRNEPEWMTNLRGHLERIKEQRAFSGVFTSGL